MNLRSHARVRVLAAIGVSFAMAALSLPAVAYPDRPITFIVPYAAGSTTDGAARILVQQMNETLGKPGVIDNRVGAGGTIGLTAAARSKPDGYTFVFTGMSAHIIASFTIPGLPWDPVKSFDAVSEVAIVPLAMAINTTLPPTNIAEFIDYAKARPGKLTFATLGPSTAQSLAMTMFMQRAGIKMREVPYKTSGQILIDTGAGRIDLDIDNVVNVLPGLQPGGGLRALAVTTSKRVDAVNGVPTLSETAIPDFNVASWVGLAAPAGTPPETITVVNDALRKAIASAEYKQWLQTNGAVAPEHTDPKSFGAFIERELKLWKSAADDAGVGMPK